MKADFYGAWDWTELAACLEDLRFTGNKPDDNLAEQLGRICKGCEVFTQCHARAEEFGWIEVFAAGQWREA